MDLCAEHAAGDPTECGTNLKCFDPVYRFAMICATTCLVTGWMEKSRRISLRANRERHWVYARSTSERDNQKWLTEPEKWIWNLFYFRDIIYARNYHSRESTFREMFDSLNRNWIFFFHFLFGSFTLRFRCDIGGGGQRKWFFFFLHKSIGRVIVIHYSLVHRTHYTQK